MSKRVWHSGPPPHVGWWESDWYDIKEKNTWRWWNGKGWSLPCVPEERAERAANFAKDVCIVTEDILWTTYWPENARVPRIDPR